MAQFTNQAQLSYSNGITNSNIAVGEIQEVLSATKTAISPNYNIGTDITYAISIVNTGNGDITGLTVTDNLGAYMAQDTVVPLTYETGTLKYYVNGVLQNAPAVTAGTSLVITGISVPAGGTAMLLYEAIVNQFAPLATGSTITNEAVISGTGISNMNVTSTVPVQETPNLSITKSISPVPVDQNGELTYTFYIQNTGNVKATAADNVMITDVFDPVLSNLSVSFNGTPWVADADYSYVVAVCGTGKTGTFNSVKGKVTVPCATYAQDVTTGAWITSPGVSKLVICGTI